VYPTVEYGSHEKLAGTSGKVGRGGGWVDRSVARTPTHWTKELNHVEKDRKKEENSKQYWQVLLGRS
jgi:hypothetical protein